MSARATRLLLPVWFPVLLLAIWWFASASSTSLYFPPLHDILDTVRNQWLFDEVGTNLLPSLKRVALGYLLAVVVGGGVGVALGLNQLARRAFEPILEFLRAVPAPAMIPVIILLFGINDREKVAIVAFGAVWPILLNTVDGVRGVDQSLHDMSRSYGITGVRKLRNVVLPAASPQIFAGLRVALAMALLLVIFAELFAATNGLGFYILNAQSTFAITDMWAGMIVLAVVALLANSGFMLVERRVLAWHRGWRASIMGESNEMSSRPRPKEQS